MHVTCTPTLTHYQVHESRGQEALEAVGILPRFAGTSVHDGWGSYFLYDCSHALCLAHLLRNLTDYLSSYGIGSKEEFHAEPFFEERCIDALFVTKTQEK